MPRKRFLWKVRDNEVQLGDRTIIVGILNVTPDSFSDGGQYSEPDRAYARAMQLEEQGADIVDIGAESTRPNAKPITEEDEWRRLAPVLKRLRGKLTIPISVDTYKSVIAQRAFDLGVQIVNDPTGLTFDPNLPKTVTQYDGGLILNHMRGTPETWARLPGLPDPITTVVADLQACVHRARHGGVDMLRIVVDPGLGFGKRKEENHQVLAHLRQLAKLDLPILSGPSRKGFLNQSTPEGLLMATAAAVTASILAGAHMVRIHDVAELMPAIQVADTIAKYQE
ncbi:MAG: dihydropteroate synthase [Bryobacterales bacterium]|nr:dihydropteroate synthase [Bryobacterales bacterium]